MTTSTRFRAPHAGALCPLAAGLVLVAALAAAGCGGTTAGSFQSRPTSVPLVERNYTFVAHGMKGEACKSSFLGFGIGDQSYAEAINQIHQTVPEKFRPEYQLVNVVDDWTFDFYLLVWRSCTVVSADVVVLREPALPVVEQAGAGSGVEAVPAADTGDEPGTPAVAKPTDNAAPTTAPAGKPAAKAPEKPKPKQGKGGIVSPYED